MVDNVNKNNCLESSSLVNRKCIFSGRSDSDQREKPDIARAEANMSGFFAPDVATEPDLRSAKEAI